MRDGRQQLPADLLSNFGANLINFQPKSQPNENISQILRQSLLNKWDKSTNLKSITCWTNEIISHEVNHLLNKWDHVKTWSQSLAEQMRSFRMKSITCWTNEIISYEVNHLLNKLDQLPNPFSHSSCWKNEVSSQTRFQSSA